MYIPKLLALQHTVEQSYAKIYEKIENIKENISQKKTN